MVRSRNHAITLFRMEHDPTINALINVIPRKRPRVASPRSDEQAHVRHDHFRLATRDRMDRYKKETISFGTQKILSTINQ